MNFQPDNREIPLLLAEHLITYYEGYEGAKIIYENLLTLNINDQYAYIKLAEIVSGHYNDNKLARMYYSKALELPIVNANLLRNYVLFLIRNFNDYLEASIVYKRLVNRWDASPVDWFSYAELLDEKLSDYETAKQAYEMAIKLNPRNLEWNEKYASMLEIKLGDKDMANMVRLKYKNRFKK
jgi:tetratricopeptide (TPR) repeat protein